MEITPNLKVTRFAQLEPGDLFICLHDDEAFFAIVAKDPTEDGEKVMVPLGPRFPNGVNGPSLMHGASATVISFGKEYLLRLPSRSSGWLANEPAPDESCILVNEDGAYLRANFRSPQLGVQSIENFLRRSAKMAVCGRRNTSRLALPAGVGRSPEFRWFGRGAGRCADGSRRHQPRWARLSPRAVRAVERIGPYEHALGIAPSLHVHAALATCR